jgi:hypothetical protein
MAMDAVLRAQSSGEPWHRYAASVFLTVAISSRPIYAVAAILLVGSIFQTAGVRRMTEFLLALVVVSVALNGPFFLNDPSRFPTAQLLNKLSVFPHFMHATIVLPALGMAIACLGFIVPMRGDRIFGLMAGALAAMLYPVFLFELATRSLDPATLATAFYSLPVTVFGGIWISSLWKDLHAGTA